MVKKSEVKAAKPPKSALKTKKVEPIAKAGKIKKERTSSEMRERRLSRRFHKLKVTKEGLATRGVLYVGHLPKGFNETELKNFF